MGFFSKLLGIDDRKRRKENKIHDAAILARGPVRRAPAGTKVPGSKRSERFGPKKD